MNRTVLAIGIIFLLMGVSVVSSTGNIVKDTQTNYNLKDTIDVSKELLSRGQTAYAYIAYSPGGYQEGPCYFDLDNPEDIEELAPTESIYFLSGGTWSYDYGWFGVEYNTGILWTIDHETGDMQCIGGGGTHMGDLAWDECTSTLYGTISTGFYEIDPGDGGQIFIGGSSGISMRGIAFDSYCICYGVGYNGYTYNLYTIDFSTLEITFVATLTNFSYYYTCNIEFDKDIYVLYLLTGSGLYTCDTDTGECTLVGNTGGTQLTALAIPFWDDTDTFPPVTTYSLDPPVPDGENGWYVSDVKVTLNATDDMSGVKEIKYRIGGGATQIIVGDNGTFTLNQYDDGDDVLVEYWAIDNAGHEETPHNLFTIDMDQTKPKIDITYEIIGGHPLICWDFLFTATATDVTSGMERVEFYNDLELQEIVYGPGPTYQWEFRYYFDMNIDIRADAYDRAGNMWYEYVDIRDKSTNNVLLRLLERFPLLQRLCNVWRSFIE